MKGTKRDEAFDHSGSTLDSFLDEEGVRGEVEAVAVKRVLAGQLEQAMQQQHKTKQAMARELHTSRSQLDRLLDPTNVSVSLRHDRARGQSIGQESNYSDPGCQSWMMTGRSRLLTQEARVAFNGDPLKPIKTPDQICRAGT